MISMAKQCCQVFLTAMHLLSYGYGLEKVNLYK